MKNIFLIIAAAIALQGCAFTSEVIDIQYVPQQNVSVIHEAGNSAVQVRVDDSRLDKTRVSSKKNGYGMETAPILSRRDVPTIVSEAIQQELSARGFKLGTASPSVLVTADVNRFYNDHKPGLFAGDAVAELEFLLSVKSVDGRELYRRGVAVQGKEANIQLATGNNASLALGKALSEGMAQLFSDQAFIDALTNGAFASRNRIDDHTESAKSKLLDELAADKTISYEEYLRRQQLILRR